MNIVAKLEILAYPIGMSLLLASVLLATVQDAVPVDLFDGKSLDGWHMDVPELDNNPSGTKPFIVRDGMLVSLGKPTGHLITDRSFGSYRLTVQYRYSKGAGNCGVVVHVSKPRFRGFLPQGIEAQLMSGNAGDFHMFGEKLFKPGAPTESAGKNLTDDSEKSVGEWNEMIVECKGETIKVWVNGTLVNHGVGSTAQKGQIAIQSEGAEVEFRKVHALILLR